MRKGVLFSLMALLLILSIFGLYTTDLKQDASIEGSLSELNSFREVSDKYANIKDNFSFLTANEVQSEISHRLLPFSYSIDDNTFTTNFDVPVSPSRVDRYLSTLNAFRLFVEDANYQRQYDGLNVDVDLPLPISWGGGDTNVGFNVEPFCMRKSILDNNSVVYDFSCADYSYSSLRRQDMNFTFGVHDFNSLVCSFNGSVQAGCGSMNNDYNSADSRPFMQVKLIDTNCSKCLFPAGTNKTIRGHFDILQPSWIAIACIGNNCITPRLDINFNLSSSTRISYSGSRVPVVSAITFDSDVTGFRFADVNIMVENTYFGTKRWS